MNHSTLAWNREASEIRMSLLPRPITQVPASRKSASSSACDDSVMNGQSGVLDDIRSRMSWVVPPFQPIMPRERSPRPRDSPHCQNSESPRPNTVGLVTVQEGSAAAGEATARTAPTSASEASAARTRRCADRRASLGAASNQEWDNNTDPFSITETERNARSPPDYCQ